MLQKRHAEPRSRSARARAAADTGTKSPWLCLPPGAQTPRPPTSHSLRMGPRARLLQTAAGNSRQTQSKTEEPYFCGSQGPGSVPSGRDAMARGLAGAYKHERCRGEGFSPFHACPAPAGAAGHARDTLLRTGGRIAKAQPIQNPVLRFALSPSVRQVQPNERRPGDTWSSLCFSTGQPRVTDPNLQSAAGAWVRPGLSGH